MRASWNLPMGPLFTGGENRDIIPFSADDDHAPDTHFLARIGGEKEREMERERGGIEGI